MSNPAIDGAVLRRIDAVPLLADPHRTVEPLPGGLTNQNFKVTTADGVYVARLSGGSSELLAIDRQAEYVNSMAACESGVAPEVVAFQPMVGILVVRWVIGRTLSETDLHHDATLARIAGAVRELHAGQAFASRFDMFALQRRYLDTVVRSGFRLPDRYTEYMPQVDRIRTVLAMHPPTPVPCHNDLLAENFIDGADRMWIIDFEYSGTNDPCFELGNIASESHLGDDELTELVRLYFGSAEPRLVARTRLQALMSQYGWTLWGVIQHGVRDLRVDFWSWAMDKYERAVATFGGPHFDRLLDAAADP